MTNNFEVIFILIIIGAFLSCNSNKNDKVNNNKLSDGTEVQALNILRIADLNKNRIVFADTVRLKKLIKKSMQFFGINDNMEILNVKIPLFENQSIYYLVAEGRMEISKSDSIKGSFITAFQIDFRDQAFYNIVGPQSAHLCTCDHCNGCDFDFSKDGSIKGCDISKRSSNCNHTTSFFDGREFSLLDISETEHE